eukprot:72297_1
MGVDVTFYPDNNPNALFDRYANYTDWCEEENVNNCSPYPPYPQFYFEDIKNNKYDLLFEIWPVMEFTGKAQQYYDNSTVTFGGISGAFAESGWYVPQYVYDETPEWMVPKALKENQIIRQTFIDAYTINSDTNWVDQWYINNTDTNYKFDLPTNTTPIIFGSSRAYAISNYSNKLIKNVLNGGMDWHFVPMGSEEMLTQFVIEMYRNHLPFIANLYSPHLDFATILNETKTNFMKFERVLLPRNPNNDITDECYVDGKCSFPLSPLSKIVNPIIEHTFPEIYEFLLDFRVTTNDLNDIIHYYQDISSLPQYSQLTDHQKWYETACKWFTEQDRKEDSITDHWHKDIIRFDCIYTNESEGCGFNYYYQTFEHALGEYNAIKIPLYESIAGYCMNATSSVECNCTYIEFQGVNCRQSCPFIGPIPDSSITNQDLNGILNGSVKSIDNYTVFFCHGHGICDIEHSTCKCADGYAGNKCEIKYEIFKYDSELIVIWIVLFLILLITLSISVIWMWKHKKFKAINALSVKMSTGFTVGLMLLCIGAVLYLFHPLNDVLCIVYFYTYGVGAMLTIMSPLCKTARVAIIFAQARQLKQISIPDKKLLMYLSAAVALETVICVIYAVLHQINGGVDILYHEDFLREEYVCNTSNAVQYVRIGNYVFIILFLVLLCYFGFQNRNTWKIFREQRCIYFSSFFSLFVFVMLIVFNAVTDDINALITTQSGGVFIVITIIWILFYGVRIYNFYKYPTKRQPSKRRLPSATASHDQPSYVNRLQKQRELHGDSTDHELQSIKE